MPQKYYEPIKFVYSKGFIKEINMFIRVKKRYFLDFQTRGRGSIDTEYTYNDTLKPVCAAQLSNLFTAMSFSGSIVQVKNVSAE